MTSLFVQADLDLDLADYDLWAIRCMVREGRWMNLTREEQIIAAHLMKRKGMDNREIAERLRTCIDTAQRYTNLKPGLDIDSIPERVSGAKLNRVKISRSDVRGRC